MPAVAEPTTSHYEILSAGKTIATGQVRRSPQRTITPAEYVDTRMGTAHSRWMIAPGPWMPFSMVKLSPDTQNPGWQAGYEPSFENIAGFSHIHEWTMAGVSIIPTIGPLQIHEGKQHDPDSGYRSRLDKSTEQAPIGYYRADLTDYGVKAELTSTTRCGFHRYTFPQDKDSRILIDLQFGSECHLRIRETEIRKVSSHRAQGLSTYQSRCWGPDGVQDYTVHFVIEFDRPIKAFGVWRDGEIEPGAGRLQTKAIGDAGAYAEFDTREHPVVQARVGISLVSIDNAALNLKAEVTDRFDWNFNAVRDHHVQAGNGLANAYLGDEDQGQMSVWFVMTAIGLFQTDGGCRVNPIYEIGSPLYEKTVIDLGQRYGRGKTFTIEARDVSRNNNYAQCDKSRPKDDHFRIGGMSSETNGALRFC